MKTEQGKDIEQYLRTGELMEMLAISRSTVYRLIADGMPCMKVGSVNRFSRDRVLAWLEGGDESEQARTILQEAQEILEEVRNMRKQGETAGQKR